MRNIESMLDRTAWKWGAARGESPMNSLPKAGVRPVITISRSVGADGEEIAANLARVTQFELYDKELLDAVAADIGVQSMMIESLDEQSRSELQSWFDGMIRGRIIDRSDYLRSLTRILGALARHGKSIIIGRGANIILGHNNGFHVRVTGSTQARAGRISTDRRISIKEARDMVEMIDHTRAEFIRKSFGRNIDDASNYDLMINTDVWSITNAVELLLYAYNKKPGSFPT